MQKEAFSYKYYASIMDRFAFQITCSVWYMIHCVILLQPTQIVYKIVEQKSVFFNAETEN